MNQLIQYLYCIPRRTLSCPCISYVTSFSEAHITALGYNCHSLIVVFSHLRVLAPETKPVASRSTMNWFIFSKIELILMFDNIALDQLTARWNSPGSPPDGAEVAFLESTPTDSSTEEVSSTTKYKGVYILAESSVVGASTGDWEPSSWGGTWFRLVINFDSNSSLTSQRPEGISVILQQPYPLTFLKLEYALANWKLACTLVRAGKNNGEPCGMHVLGMTGMFTLCLAWLWTNSNPFPVERWKLGV